MSPPTGVQLAELGERLFKAAAALNHYQKIGRRRQCVDQAIELIGAVRSFFHEQEQDLTLDLVAVGQH
jgi:hypothetical protein